MKEQFDNWTPNPENRSIIDAANNALDELRGFEPTLRSVYYNLVTYKIIENKQTEYKRLGDILTKARNAGLVDWRAFEDKGRVLDRPYFQEEPSVVLSDIHTLINFDMWARQDVYVEVWVEKQAQEGVVRRACDEFRVPWLSCKGYLSATAAYNAGKRFRRAANYDNKRPVLIHLGDHDPSGIDMTRDNGARIEKYGELYDIEVNRIALNMDQVEKHNLPPDPAKLSDSRAKEYIADHGERSWELDALKPQTLLPIIKNAIKGYIDPEIWEQTKQEEREIRNALRWIGENPDEAIELVEREIAPEYDDEE